MKKQLTAVGVTCGIGSLLVGARKAGFDVVGNIEWRKYYHKKDAFGQNTFEMNFPDAVFPNKIDDLELDEIERLMKPDLAMGHPECGHYSLLNMMNNRDLINDPADIPLFVDLIKKLQPKYFVMDDLPGSFVAFPMEEYVNRLPNYDLFPEWISNWGYGNIQRHRNRMFMIGSLKRNKWTFVPGEKEHDGTIKSTLEDLGEPIAGSNMPNHDPHPANARCCRATHLETLGRGVEGTYGQLGKYLLDPKRPRSRNMVFIKEDGTTADRPGNLANPWEGTSGVLCGNAIKFHPTRGLPYSIRERARIQGFPDDFVFYGTRLDRYGQWEHEKNIDMVKQTGKAMPIQFAEYVAKQIFAALNDKPFRSSGRRVIKPNDLVSEAKKWYCDNVGYSRQRDACAACWLSAQCAIKKRKRIRL